jgi:hypothetical protein
MNSTSNDGRGGAASAICIGPANCEATTGMPWRFVRDHAPELGVEFIAIGGKRVILASALLAALERRGNAAPADDVDELAEMRARIARAG